MCNGNLNCHVMGGHRYTRPQCTGWCASTHDCSVLGGVLVHRTACTGWCAKYNYERTNPQIFIVSS